MVVIGLKLYRNLSDKLVTCSGIVKRRSCRYFLHYNSRLMRFFHVPSVYLTTFHVPLRYIERYFTYSIVYWNPPCVWLCIIKHYYRFKLPCTLGILGDPTRIPYLSEKIPLVVLCGSIHRKQHSRRLLRTYP